MMATAASDAAAFTESGFSGAFRIDREGVWHHEDVEVTHPGVLRNLYANLRAEAETYHLQVGPRRVPVQVDDAPFVVVRAEAGADPESVTLHLSDGSRERLEAGTLLMDRRGVPYCRVKDGQFRARLSIAAWLQVAQNVEVDSASGDLSLVLGGRRLVLRQAG